MHAIAEKLKQRFQDRLAGEMEHAYNEGLDADVYWKPLTGRQMKQIVKAEEKSKVEMVCTHVKLRALDEKGEPIFKDIPIVGLMNDFDFEDLAEIYLAMTGVEHTVDELEKN